MSFKYLTNKDNTRYFTYKSIYENNKDIDLNSIFLLYVSYYKNKNEKIQILSDIVDKFYSKDILNLDYLPWKFQGPQYILKEVNLPEIFFNEISVRNLQSKYHNTIKGGRIKNLKIFYSKDIKDLDEKTTKLIKEEVSFKRLDNVEKFLDFLNNKNIEEIKNFIKNDNDNINYKCILNNGDEHFAKLEKFFLDDFITFNIEKIKTNLNLIYLADQKLKEELRESKIINYNGSILKEENYSKKHELFYLIGVDKNKNNEGFIGFRGGSSYRAVYTPSIVLNIEDAAIFSEKTSIENKKIFNIEITDRVYIDGNIKKVIPLKNEISSLAIKCQSLIDKSYINNSLKEIGLQENKIKKNKL